MSEQISLESMLSQTPVTDKPPRIVLYGTDKIGKTTFATQAPSPIIIPTERGMDGVRKERRAAGINPVVEFPLCTTFEEFEKALNNVAYMPHNCRTLIIDSADWLEPLIWKGIETSNKVQHIGDIGFGKGYIIAANEWRRLTSILDYISAQRGMIIIIISHYQIITSSDPELPLYDKYDLKLHHKAAKVIQEWADIVAFAKYKVYTKTEDSGFGGERKVATGEGQRILCLQERPGYKAGNRYNFPAEIPLDWNQFIQLFK